MKTSLTDMSKNIYAKVVAIEGGANLKAKLEGLGIREGVKIKKINQQLMGGPIIIKVARTQIAIGNGMARKVYVEINNE